MSCCRITARSRWRNSSGCWRHCTPGAEHFPEQVQYLVAYLDGALPPDHPFAGVKIMPAGRTAPEVWLLGSSDYSGALAAQLGLRFAFAHFISAGGSCLASPGRSATA